MSSSYQSSSNNPRSDRTLRQIAITIALVVGISAFAIASVYLLGWRRGNSVGTPTVVAQATPAATRSVTSEGTPLTTLIATPALTPLESPTGVALERTPSPGGAAYPSTEGGATLRLLDNTEVPKRDLYAIAARLKLKTTAPIPTTTGKPPGNYSVGHADTFYVNNISAHSYYTLTATIKKVTDHVYWYAQDGKSVDTNALEKAATTFDQKIYPNNRALFGSEWAPGVDNDPRLTVLFANIPGVGGYYSSADEYTRAINPYSNEREMIYLNTGSGWFGIESTLAHEFQHMIHWNEHANHDVWLNEGMSVLASALNGYEDVGVDTDFMANTDTQLNAWDSTPNASIVHYGASFLFLDFLRAHYGGKEILSSIVAAPGSGTDAIDNALAKLGKKERFKDVFENWVLANILDGQSQAAKEGLDFPDRDVTISPHVRVTSYPKEYKGDVSQFGIDYVELAAPNNGASLKVNFTGQAETGVIGAPPHSGSHIWWSNRGDVSDMSMTRKFDLRSLKSATLDFYAWFDIEKTFDFAYVEVSTDGGTTWDSLPGKYTTAENPNGTSQGNGFTGKSKDQSGADSNGWVHENLDLGLYAGKEVSLRFEYITDDGYNAQGFAVDDLSIPELGFKDDAESDAGWQGAGFVRVYKALPQSYYLSVIKLKPNDDGYDIQPITVDASGVTNFTVEGLGSTYSRAILVVAGETPHTLLKASYTLDMQAVP